MGRQGGTSRRGIRMLVLSAATAGLFAFGAASAGAATVDPPALDFGSQPVGTTSVPHPVTLTAPCSTPLVANLCTTSVLDTYGVNLATTGDFGGTTDCPAQLTPVTTEFVSCTIELVFHPTGGGVRTGVLNTGTDVSGLIPGPTVALSGTGVPTTEDGIASTQPRRKKCKKHRKHHRNAHSAKKRKCKKKRR